MTPELISDMQSRKMTEHEYRTYPALSRSELWRINDSPEKFKWYKQHPPEQTDALLFGSLVHKLVLEGESFFDDYAVVPDGADRRTKEGKATYEQFVADSQGKIIVFHRMLDPALDMSGAALRNRLVLDLIENSQHEIPFFWTDEDTGVPCKCRVDAITEIDGKYTIIDYKSTTNAKTEVFNQEIWKYGYHFQAAFYSEGVMNHMGLTYRPDFIIIAQEKKPPYSVNVIKVTDDVMLAGIDKMRELLGIYKECCDTGVWWGYNGFLDDMNETILPGWMQLGVEEEDE